MAEKIPYDMIRWSVLKPRYQDQLGFLFGSHMDEAERQAFQDIKGKDADAISLIEKAGALWKEIKTLSEEGPHAFRVAYAEARNLDLEGNYLGPAPYDHTRVNLMVWYNQIHHRGLWITPSAMSEESLPATNERLVFIDLLKPRMLPPSVKTVATKARELVNGLGADERKRYARQRLPRVEKRDAQTGAIRVTYESRRYSEALLKDLCKAFGLSLKKGRSMMQRRLDDSDFSLCKEYPDLCG